MTHAIMFNGRVLAPIHGKPTMENIISTVEGLLEPGYPLDQVFVDFVDPLNSLAAVACKAVAVVRVPRVYDFDSVELHVAPVYRPSLRACFR